MMKKYFVCLILIAFFSAFILTPVICHAAQTLPGSAKSAVGATTPPPGSATGGVLHREINQQPAELFTPQQVKITSPKENGQWSPGDGMSIQWEYKGTPPGQAKVLLVIKGAQTVHVVDPGRSWGQSGKGWIIPFYIPKSVPAGDNYQIKIVSTIDDKYRGTSALFRILPYASLSVTNPAGNGPVQAWKIGSTPTIQWKYAGDCGSHVSIKIQGGVDDGWSSHLLNGSCPLGQNGIGSLNWTIPQTLPQTSTSWKAGNKYTLLIAGVENPKCWASSGEFTVSQ
jgi:hypothetical protein